LSFFSDKQMDNKQAAEKTEAQLLRVFDYAWNKLQNGVCRREEILLKLEQGAVNHRSSLLSRARHMKHKIFGGKAGIRINGSGSVDTSSGIMKSKLPRVRIFARFRPHLVNSDNGECEAIDIPWNRTHKASTCGNRHAHRKRSEGYNVGKTKFAKWKTMPIQSNSVCGVLLEDGSSCLEEPVQGRKRCSLHRGRRVKGNLACPSSSSPCQVEVLNTESVPRLTEKLKSSVQSQESEVVSKNLATPVQGSPRQSSRFEAEVKTGEAPPKNGTHKTSGNADINGQKSFHAESQPLKDQPSGRMWFELLKAQKKSVNTHPLRGGGYQARVANDIGPICRAATDNVSFKMVPDAGRKGCEKPSETMVTGASLSRRSGWPCTCGARTSDGSPCMNQPVEGRKRCALHKGQRASRPPIPLVVE
jgi:hypothetical protein